MCIRIIERTGDSLRKRQQRWVPCRQNEWTITIERVEKAWMWPSLWRSLWIWFWTSWNKSTLEIFKKDSRRLINMKVWSTKVGIKTRQAGQGILGKEYHMVHSWCWEVPSGLIGKCWPCKGHREAAVERKMKSESHKDSLSTGDNSKSWPYEPHKPHLSSPHCPLPPWP